MVESQGRGGGPRLFIQSFCPTWASRSRISARVGFWPQARRRSPRLSRGTRPTPRLSKREKASLKLVLCAWSAMVDPSARSTVVLSWGGGGAAEYSSRGGQRGVRGGGRSVDGGEGKKWKARWWGLLTVVHQLTSRRGQVRGSLRPAPFASAHPDQSMQGPAESLKTGGWYVPSLLPRIKYLRTFVYFANDWCVNRAGVEGKCRYSGWWWWKW